jgi:hypothetical protein
LPTGDGGLHLATAAGGPELPAIEIETSAGLTSSAGEVARAARAQLGLELNVLAFLARRRLDEDTAFEALVLAEDTVPKQATPPGLRRAGLEEAEPLAARTDGAWPAGGAWPRGGEAVRAWLAEQRTGEAPAVRVPWARPGWRAEAVHWIGAQLSALGLGLAGPVETGRTWSLSCVLRAPTPAGDYYFKAVPPLFGHEPALTRFLAARFPGAVPEVAAVDLERRWMLMPAFAGAMLQDEPASAVWAAALGGYGRLQAALVEDAAELLGLGCPDRRLDRLAAAAPLALDEADALLVGQAHGLEEGQVAALHDLLPALQAACGELAALGPPPTLEHGDLHAGNIITTGQGAFVYYDWTDGALAHPFNCLAAFLERVPAEWQAELCDAYLGAWEAFGDRARLEGALRLARPLGALHMALSYRDIWVQTEPGQRWQLAGALPFFLKEVLKHSGGLQAD